LVDVAFENHISIIAHIWYMNHPSNGKSKVFRQAKWPIRPELIPVFVA